MFVLFQITSGPKALERMGQERAAELLGQLMELGGTREEGRPLAREEKQIIIEVLFKHWSLNDLGVQEGLVYFFTKKNRDETLEIARELGLENRFYEIDNDKKVRDKAGELDSAKKGYETETGWEAVGLNLALAAAVAVFAAITKRPLRVIWKGIRKSFSLVFEGGRLERIGKGERRLEGWVGHRIEPATLWVEQKLWKKHWIGDTVVPKTWNADKAKRRMLTAVEERIKGIEAEGMKAVEAAGKAARARAEGEGKTGRAVTAAVAKAKRTAEGSAAGNVEADARKFVEDVERAFLKKDKYVVFEGHVRKVAGFRYAEGKVIVELEKGTGVRVKGSTEAMARDSLELEQAVFCKRPFGFERIRTRAGRVQAMAERLAGEAREKAAAKAVGEGLLDGRIRPAVIYGGAGAALTAGREITRQLATRAEGAASERKANEEAKKIAVAHASETLQLLGGTPQVMLKAMLNKAITENASKLQTECLTWLLVNVDFTKLTSEKLEEIEDKPQLKVTDTQYPKKLVQVIIKMHVSYLAGEGESVLLKDDLRWARREQDKQGNWDLTGETNKQATEKNMQELREKIDRDFDVTKNKKEMDAADLDLNRRIYEALNPK